MNTFYRYCGLILRSDLDFPELPIVRTEADTSADLTVRQSPVPHSLSDAVYRAHTYEHNGREALWRLEGVARYRVSDSGRTIEVDADPRAEAAVVRLFLLRPVFALAGVLRGEWLLSASAVEREGRVSAFVGPSASGKSTAAAALLNRGYRLASDSLLRVTRASDGCMLAHPQAPWLWLWPDAIKHLGLDEASTESLRSGISLRRMSHTIIDKPLPLTRVAVLREQRGDDLELFAPSAQKGAKAFDMLLQFTAGITWLGALADRRRLFLWSAQIAASAKVEQLDIPWGWEHINALVEQLEKWEKKQEKMDGLTR